MAIKIILLVLFFSSMIGVGVYSRKHAGNVNDFVLGGRAVGPWLTAFAYGTSYFSAISTVLGSISIDEVTITPTGLERKKSSSLRVLSSGSIWDIKRFSVFPII